MNKRSPIILTIIVIILTMISFVLGISSFGEDWVYFWVRFDLKELLIVLAILIGSGLVLGIFLFRNKNYRERIKLTVPITFIVFNFYSFYTMVNYHYGLSEYYNHFSAKEDLKKGNVQILTAGQIINFDSYKTNKAKDSIRLLFGFKFLHVGIYANGLQRYNEVMKEHLEKKNGKDWEKRLQLKIDSIDKVHKN